MRLVHLGFLIFLTMAVGGFPAFAAVNLGFTCDVNTRECSCTGTWEGADCQAMAKNCKDASHACFGKNGKPTFCSCSMGRMSLVHPNLLNNGNEFTEDAQPASNAVVDGNK